jgi:ATP-dependent DNA ligase
MPSRLRSRRTPVGFIEALAGDGIATARALPGAKPAPSAGFIAPALATLRSTVPTAANFVHELKLDGYRIQAHVLEGGATLYTRSGLDWTNRFATIAADARRLPANSLVLDGEIISADPDGRPDFSALQDDLKQACGHRLGPQDGGGDPENARAACPS